MATIVAAAVAAVALASGYFTFRESQELQAHATAAGLLDSYYQFQLGGGQSATLCEDLRSPECVWHSDRGVMLAGMVFALTGGRSQWEGIVRQIIRDHGPYLEASGLNCRHYEDGFIQLIRDTLPRFQCSPIEPRS